MSQNPPETAADADETVFDALASENESSDETNSEVRIEASTGALKSYTPRATTRRKKGQALKFPRRFTAADQDVFDSVEWETRTAMISGEDGKAVFEQTDCEIPKSWSQLATNVVVSKYFRGPMGSPQREYSVRQVIGRVADTIHGWGREGGYFAADEDAQAFRDELAYLLLHQYGSFNSPVWFNIGVKGARQQASACFINSVYDDMESIMELAATEARLFKGGSGAGSNLWRIRSSREHLSGGGIASGPVSFMRGWDAFAGAIKSGGTCLAPYQRVYTENGPVAVEELARREEFITLSFDPPANRYKAKRARAWLAGTKRVVRVTTDKGHFDLSFDHPVKLSSGEYVAAGELQPGFSLFACSLDTQHGHVRVHLRDGKKGKEFLHRLVAADVMGEDLTGRVVHHRDGNRLNNAPGNLQVMTQAAHAALHGRALAREGEHSFQTGSYPHAGAENGMHRDAAFWHSDAAQDYRAAQGQVLTASGRAQSMQKEAARQKSINTAFRVLNAGWPIDSFEQYVQGRQIVTGRIASIVQLRAKIEREFGSYDAFKSEVARQNHRVIGVETIGEMDVYDVEVQCPTPDDKSPQTGHNFLIWDGDQATGSGVIVANTRRAAKMVILNADHPDISEFIVCKADEEKKAWSLIEAGYNGGFNVPGGAYDSVDFQNANHSVRVTDAFMRAAENNMPWTTRAVMTGEPVETKNAKDLLMQIATCTHICGDPGLQYDTTINDWHTCANTDRIYASNPCCITGDTLVAVADGRNAVAIRDLVGTEVPVYAHDHANGQTTISRMWNIEAKRHNAPIYRVTLDDGSSFRATDDHLIMQRDGSYRMVRDLQSGDALMPFHSQVLAAAKNRTKRRYYWKGQSWQPQYRAVWEYAHGAQLAAHHIHHGDFDALNDSLDNLQLLPAETHNALHREKMLGDNNPARRGMNDAWRANIARAMSGENNPHFGHTHRESALQTMREKAAVRWSDPAQHEAASQNAKAWMAEAKSEGRSIGRPRGPRFERCCPVCRANFETAREAQIFCSLACRHSPMGMQMCGTKTWDANRGRALSADHRAKLSASGRAAADSATKSRAGATAARNNALRAARLMLDHGQEISLAAWDEMRPQMRALGATRVPTKATAARHFFDDAQLQEQAALFNHKVVSVEFCGHEDVYDGTVDTHHNFAILTSQNDSCVADQQNFSGIFIHNSEFVFLDDTACNLASLNLMKYRDADGIFDAEAFVHASETFITAQEILVSNASYPTEKIAINSEDYRPLGLGYANLGALLMAQGTAYDSDEGRSLAGAITAIMTGAAYAQSARIAANIGPFNGYDLNREPMLRVIRKHRDAVSDIRASQVPPQVLAAAQRVWDEALVLGEKHGYRNAQATVLAPTGCLVGGSLVATDRGLVRLETLGNVDGETWQEVDFSVQTDDGPRRATKFFINGVADTRKIRTQAGYAIQGTLKHRIKVVDAQTGEWQWKRFADVASGDVVPLAMNGLIGEAQQVLLPPLGDLHWNNDFQTRVPREMSAELAELVGYFMGDGSLHAKGLRLCVAENDTDVTARLQVLAEQLFGLQTHCTAQKGYTEVAIHSVALTIWWDACGFGKTRPHDEHSGKGWTPRVPDAVLHSNDATIYGAFLRGLYEADGTLTEGVPAFSTASESFADEVRSLLLILGFPTTSKIGASGWGSRDLHTLRLRNSSYNARFRGEIGFMGERKNGAILEIKDTTMAKRDRIPLALNLVNELAPCDHPLRDAMLLSLRRHSAVSRASVTTLFAQTGDERLRHALDFFYDEVISNDDGGAQMTFDLSVPDNVTYVANGFVSHNTIAFMMDCDTTGIEPDIALVKYKKLVGGGLLKIVNQTVPAALQKLGYSGEETQEIVDYIDANDTIEGAPHLRDEDMSIFDCAFKAMNGTRSIHYLGHIKMMGAAQPFLSGAISKCVTGETLIASDEGIKPIAAFYRGEKPGEFSPVAARLASIGAPQDADMFYYGGLRPTIKASWADGRSIEGTENHRVKVANAEGYDWKRLDAVEAGDYVAVRLGANLWAARDADLLEKFSAIAPHGSQKTIRLPQRMTPDLARFLGYYIAEGNMTSSNYLVRVTNLNPQVLAECERIVAQTFGITSRIETDKRNGVTSWVCASKSLCEFLTHIGAGGDSSRKEIPWAVLQSREICVREFVGGLWLDGYVRNDGMTAICLNSSELLRQLQVVLNNFGLRAQRISKYNKPYDKYFDELGLHGADARRFASLFRLDDAHKTAALENLCATTKKVQAVHSDVIPAFRAQIQAFIRERHDTNHFRHVFDKRTRHLSRHTVKSVADFYGEAFFAAIPELREILQHNIHFVALRAVESGYAPVYDFQVPTNHAFLGNSIVNHNTVNLPADCSVQDVFDAYLESWKQCLKAVAIYRDGSKRTQPLSTASDATKAQNLADAKASAHVLRRKLPDERAAITHKFSIAGQEGYFTVGLFEDGAPGEIFIKMNKEGSTISGLMDSFAVAISMALQYGVPLKVLVNKFMHTRFEPSGYTTNKEIPIAKSLMDYIFRWFDLKFQPNGDTNAPAHEPSLLDVKEEDEAAKGGEAKKA